MWNDGYVMGIDYINAYFYGLNPLNIDFNLTLAGVKNTKDSSISYLELGFGKGYSLALHSVCNKGEFIGVDFNPSFAFNTKELSPNSKIYNESFKDFYKRAISEKMSFDYIVLFCMEYGAGLIQKTKNIFKKSLINASISVELYILATILFPAGKGDILCKKSLKLLKKDKMERPLQKSKIPSKF